MNNTESLLAAILINLMSINFIMIFKKDRTIPEIRQEAKKEMLDQAENIYQTR